MTKKEALEFFNPSGNRGVTDDFMKELYQLGYSILSPDEKKKVDGMTILAEIHVKPRMKDVG